MRVCPTLILSIALMTFSLSLPIVSLGQEAEETVDETLETLGFFVTLRGNLQEDIDSLSRQIVEAPSDVERESLKKRIAKLK